MKYFFSTKNYPVIFFVSDTGILLLYLRHAKFSQLRARETIENNCVLKTHETNLHNDYNSTDPTVVKFLKTG